MSSTLTAPPLKSLQDAALKEKLQELRRTDNFSNLYYLLRTYLYLAIVLGGAVGFDLYRQSAGWSWLVSVPVFFAAIVLVGAGQHQLSSLAHEGSHHILFRNRYLNELGSDLLCMYPMFSSTYHYRLQHLAHHQFVNDPLRDPDVSQLETSGHRLPFPMEKKAIRRALLKQLWPMHLIRFMRVRAAYNATGTDKNPYMRKGQKSSKVAVLVGLFGILAQVIAVTVFVRLEQPFWLAVVPPALFAVVAVVFAVLPSSKYTQSRLHSVIHLRWLSVLRVGFISVVFNSLGWIELLTGQWAALYYILLWVVPLFTSFSFFMILRQTVQHGNADRGLLSNTRVFFVNRFINFAVFPLGQDFHLPHHLYATVPHFRLRRLHELLLTYPEYREKALEVHGYFVPEHQPPTHPTVLDVLGPEYAAKEFHGVHIDNSVLEDCEVEEKAEIEKEGANEVRRLAEEAGVPGA